MDFFIDKDDEIVINIFTGNVDGKIVADTSRDVLTSIYGNVEFIENHQVYFRVPNFSDNTTISSATMDVSSNGVKLDPALFQLKRFILLVKKWTFTDKNKTILPANETNVKNLHPMLASLIMSELDKKLTDIGA